MKSETDIAKMLGISRAQATALRRLHLTLGEDWQHDNKNGRRVLWTDEGIARIRTQLELDKPDPPKVTEEPLPVQLPTGKQMLTVKSIPMNPYVLDAVNEQGTVQRIRVKSNLVYAVNDKITAMDVGEPGMLSQVGPRPRMKGDTHYKWQLKNYSEAV